jgi:iron-sulfur cluster insertion protein
MNMTITESVVNKLTSIIAEENDPTLKLRIFVQGGGCSGMQYGFTLDNIQGEDDFVFPAGSLSVLVDYVSAQYLEGAEIDYEEDIQGASFKIRNPNATTTCGCGSSFNPY